MVGAAEEYGVDAGTGRALQARVGKVDKHAGHRLLVVLVKQRESRLRVAPVARLLLRAKQQSGRDYGGNGSKSLVML